jgi:hypothetical protein
MEDHRMNTPKVQTEADGPPTEGGSPDANPTPGIPEGATDAEPMGRPTSDRAETETAPAKSQPGPKS